MKAKVIDHLIIMKNLSIFKILIQINKKIQKSAVNNNIDKTDRKMKKIYIFKI